MKLFLAKHECEDAAVVIAADWPAAIELFTAAVHAWTTDKWDREDWPREFGRERGAGVEVPTMEPVVIGTHFARDGYEMVFRGGEWVRTGHDYWGPELRENLAGIEARRKQAEAAAAAELNATRGGYESLLKRPYPDALGGNAAADNMRGLPVCQHRACPANYCDVAQKADLDAVCADQGGRRNVG